MHLNTSFHFLVDMSNSHTSFRVFLSLFTPPITSRLGCLLLKPMQQAACLNLPTGHGSPFRLWSFTITYNDYVTGIYHYILSDSMRKLRDCVFDNFVIYTNHCFEVNEIEVIGSAIPFGIMSSKEQSRVFINTGESESSTGRRSCALEYYWVWKCS